MASRVVIDADFLRKRAEHNEGCLTTLEEIALHQLNIEKIENFDKLIRHVKILLLQNNLISKMENLTRLKELTYLNLALNNIEVIEGLENNESLEKLDMTCNFVRLGRFFESLVNLKQVKSLREVHFMGNPFTDWKNYRMLTVALAPQLVLIDGNEITPSERIQASQKYEELLNELEEEIVKVAEKDALKTPDERAKEYTPDSRREMYKDMQKEQEEKERARKSSNKDEEKKKGPTSMFNSAGEMRQCNEGRYLFKLLEWDDPEWSYFELDVPLYLETSQLKCELFPNYVSVRMKDKLTQVKLGEEIIVEESKVQRSQTTGVLMVTMKKARYSHLIHFENKKLKTAEEEKHRVEKINEANIQDLIVKQKAKAAMKSKITEDPELDDLPELE